MSGGVGSVPPSTAGVSRSEVPTWRRVVPWILVVVASLVLIVGSLTVFAKRQLLTESGWTNTSSQLLEDPTVRNALSVYLVNQLYTQVDVPAELQKRLPPQAQALAAPLAAGLQSFAVKATDALLGRPRVQQLWKKANEVAYTQFARLIKGGKYVQTTNGDVVLNLEPILQRLGESQLGAKVVAQLPPGAGQITLLHSDQLKTAQTGVRVVKALSILLSIVVLALFAAAIAFAPRRRKMLLTVGVAVLLCGLVVLIARRLLGNYIVDALTSSNPAAKVPVSHVWVLTTLVLRNIGQNFLIYGAAISLAALLAGPSRAATAVRRFLAPTLVNNPVVSYAVVAFAFLLVLTIGPTDQQRIIPLIILFAFGFVGLEVLRRQVRHEFPHALNTNPAT